MLVCEGTVEHYGYDEQFQIPEAKPPQPEKEPEETENDNENSSQDD